MYTRLASIFALLAVCQGKPELMLKNIRSPENSTYVAVTSVASENQQCLPPQIKATEVCVKQGIWIFYPETAFQATNPNHTEIYTRNLTDPAMSCYGLPPHLDKIVGSYRLAGDPENENTPALNAYVGLGYTGDELITNHSLPQVPYAFNSVIVTGGNRWQFYMLRDFEGFSECTAVGETYIPDFTARFGVQAGDINSIRIDCDKKASKLNPNHVFKGYTNFHV